MFLKFKGLKVQFNLKKILIIKENNILKKNNGEEIIDLP
jgi:hypothetical protein